MVFEKKVQCLKILIFSGCCNEYITFTIYQKQTIFFTLLSQKNRSRGAASVYFTFNFTSEFNRDNHRITSTSDFDLWLLACFLWFSELLHHVFLWPYRSSYDRSHRWFGTFQLTRSYYLFSLILSLFNVRHPLCGKLYVHYPI